MLANNYKDIFLGHAEERQRDEKIKKRFVEFF